MSTKKIYTKEECDEWDEKDVINKKEAKDIKQALTICELSKFKHGQTNLTLLQLLELIKSEKKDTVIKILCLFPETGFTGVKVNRSHVFEGLWILIFILKLDNFKHKERVIYTGIENEEIDIDYKKKTVLSFIKKTGVNASNTGGIADLYFEDFLEEIKGDTDYRGYACENKCEHNKPESEGSIKYLY